jgi:uncharacterized protein (DUF58 family)
MRERLHRLRVLLEPPRRLRMRRPGVFLVVGTFALGLATLNTGNNLLYLLLGALLGTVALSGWLSEQALRGIRVRRVLPRRVVAGQPAWVEYRVQKEGGRMGGQALLLREMVRPPLAARQEGEPGSPGVPSWEGGWVPAVEPGQSVGVRVAVTAPRRGVYPLHGLVVSTGFPFGLFEKERYLVVQASMVVWPRYDRELRPPRVGGRLARRVRAAAGAAAGAGRGDYRGLREYRPGDDPRDIHWRSTARRREPILREYDRDAADEYWIVLDTVAPDEDSGEAAVETAASLLATGLARGDRVGLAAGHARMPPSAAARGLDRGLDCLAAVRITPRGPPPDAPVHPALCVLVSARPLAGEWGDRYAPEELR